jgi:trigger factor
LNLAVRYRQLLNIGGEVKVTNEKVENRQAYLTIEMEPAEVADYQEKAYKSIVKKTSIPGFRKGKAPRPMVERTVGKEKFQEEMLNILVPEAFKKAVAQEKIEPYAQPTVNLEKTEPEVVFKAVIPLAPIVNIGDYKSVRVTPEAINVTDENVNTAIEQLRHQHATWEPIERPVEFGDMVVMDIASTIEGQTFLDRKGAQYQVTKGLLLPAPGFAEQLAGMKRDEEKEFKLTFPADYARPELANKEAQFKAKIVEIKQEKMPEVNDEFATTIRPELKTVDDLKKAVLDDIKRQLAEREKVAYEEKVVEKIMELSNVEFPPVMTDGETDNMIRSDMQRLQIEDFQDYQNTVGKTEKQIRDSLATEAQRHVKRSLILEKIAEAEKIEVSHDEVHEEMDMMVEMTEEDKRKNLEQYLETERAHETIGGMILLKKTVEHLAKSARGETAATVESTPAATEEKK